jgi:hypothetical protein
MAHLKPTHALRFALGLLSCVLAHAAFAGRPLAVDDANVNDVGSGHVEVFYQRQSGQAHTFTVAPAYGLTEGIEIGASFNRDNTADVNTSALQLKFRLTPSQKKGCNHGVTFGVQQANTGAVGSPFVNGLMSCNTEALSLHANLGLTSPTPGRQLATWGLAVERELSSITAHVEWFGVEQSSPTLQMGLRTMLSRQWQLDGTVGTSNNESLFSIGLKFLF